MAVVDLGIPPGFDVDVDALDDLVGRGIEKYDLAGRQLVVYLRELRAGASFEFSYPITPRHPLTVKTPPSRVYAYYQPEVEAFAQPIEIAVR